MTVISMLSTSLTQPHSQHNTNTNNTSASDHDPHMIQMEMQAQDHHEDLKDGTSFHQVGNMSFSSRETNASATNKSASRVSTASAAPSYYSIGRDFYDDYYTDNSEDSIDDRLDFSAKRVRVLARQNELQLLHDVYSHVQRKGINSTKKRDLKQETSVAMIRGLSGTGKSTLVKKFVGDLDKQSKCTGGPKQPLFLAGKYEELSGADPFSAIVEAFSGLAATLLQDESVSDLERIQTAIQDSLGWDISALTAVIPDLQAVIEGPNRSNKSIAVKSSHSRQQPANIGPPSEHAWNRLRFVFQKFSNAISSKERPVVMFLDDLQWCDPASLDLIQALLTDKDLQYFMFIGAFRSDEVVADHPLQQALQTIQDAQTIQNVELVNFSLKEFENFVSDVLKYDEMTDELKELAGIIQQKTEGNLFFAMQVLEELHRNGVLQFSRLTFQWEWHGDAKNLSELLADDILTAFTMKITSSPVMLQTALVTAAYTRSTLDCHTLQKLLGMNGNAISLDDLIKTLDKAVVDGLLSNNMGSTIYSFGHDRIQQAAYSLIPEGKPRDDFRTAIGEHLYKLGHAEKGEDWMLFAAADHLNATLQTGDVDDLVTSIKLNLEVGERAASVSAHATASKFLGFAMQNVMLLQGNPWEDHYDTTLRVYQLIADGELNQGRFDIGSGIAKQIMKNARCLDDRLPTQLAMAKALGRENLHRESLRMGKATLRAMRQYPKSKAALYTNVVRDLIFVKRYFKKTSDDDIVGLPLMEDTRMEMAMEFLSSMGYNSFFVGNMVQYLAIVLQMLRITFRYGVCGQSGVAFTGYSLFSNNINDMPNAYRFFKVARRILDKTKAKHLEGLQLFVFAHWVGAWKDPNDEIMAIYRRATKSSMESGDFENGMLSLTASLHHSFVNSGRLDELDFNFSNLMEQLNTYKVETVHRMTVEQWLVIQHLRGTAAVPTLDYEELEKFGPTADLEGDDENYRLLYGYMGRLQLGFYFGNYDFALEMLERLLLIPDFDKSHSTNCLRLFFSSLICCHQGTITNKKAYFRKATKFCQELRTLCKIKGLNSWHRFLLLEAHIRSSGGKSTSKAQASYDHAISAAVKSGHLQDAGLAAQLAGENFLRMDTGVLHNKVLIQARDRLVREYLGQSRDFYKKWGASALIRHLEAVHGAYFDTLIGNIKVDSSSKGGDTGSLAQTFNSIKIEWDGNDSFGELPKILTARPPPLSKDDISVISDQSAWRKSSDFVNPHTDTGDFPAMVCEELTLY
jgi:predicted ATPase